MIIVSASRVQPDSLGGVFLSSPRDPEQMSLVGMRTGTESWTERDSPRAQHLPAR